MERKTIVTTITDTECELAANSRRERSDFVAAYCLSISDDETAIETTVHVCGRMWSQEVVGSLSHATVDIIREAEPKPEERASLYLSYLNTFKARMKEADPEAVELLEEKEGGPDA